MHRGGISDDAAPEKIADGILSETKSGLAQKMLMVVQA